MFYTFADTRDGCGNRLFPAAGWSEL